MNYQPFILKIVVFSIFAYTVSATCTSNLECFNGGICNPISEQCDCSILFLGEQCQLMRRSQFSSFILSIFFDIFGAMNFYLGYQLIGAVQMLITLLIVLCFLIEKFYKDRTNTLSIHTNPTETETGVVFGFMKKARYILIVLILSWWLIDWLRTLDGRLNDASGNFIVQDLVFRG